jgi:lipoprotein-anchoring transpeptidase ErfK/SrfK
MAFLLGGCWHPCQYSLLNVMSPEQAISNSISRRQFVKMSCLGFAAALAINPFPKRVVAQLLDNSSLLSNLLERKDHEKMLASLPSGQQGRVLDDSVTVFDTPSYEGKKVSSYWRDTVLPLVGLTVGNSIDSFNMVWYKVGDEGYVHSGSLQPVFTTPNPVVKQLPPDGILAEVTVPFTDAYWDPGKNERVAYRFYYATTYWLVEIVLNPDGEWWYGVRDDKWEYVFYVRAQHLRLIPAEELAPISPSVPPEQKRIEVHIPQQVMIAYEYERPVFMARIASGAVFSNGDFSTPTGRHSTFHKRASRHMARGNLAANSYDLPGVPWNSYITEEGVAFHGTYWHNNFGQPRSHGCINLTPQASKWVYLWTKPEVPVGQEGVYKSTGTTVDVIG